ncbi:MAG: 17 kDa surface antigen [Rhodospirillales bacterium]|jgi:surface antigen|nr:17 kDa surface antigen [Rhodospirillales bacterium]
MRRNLTKSRAIILAPLLAGTLALTACQQDPYGPGMNKQTGGALVGAGLGGLLGNQFGGGSGKAFATAGGVLLGGLLGSEVGKSMDRADRAYLDQSTNRALETGYANSRNEWRNPDSGNYGYTVPQKAYQSPDGRYCREYTQTVFIGGRKQDANGTACRNPDGSWQVVS